MKRKICGEAQDAEERKTDDLLVSFSTIVVTKS